MTPGLHLFTSNRLEALAAKLGDRLAVPLPSPFMPETIVVRNKGMERWLKLQLAGRHGLCANCQFPFPEAFGYRVFRQLIPGLPKIPAVDRDYLLWRVLALLPEHLPQPEFASLQHYLEEAEDPRKAVQLAGRIAHLFDQYLVFRPALILDWEAGKGDHWQSILWRAVARNLPAPHAATLWKQLGELTQRPELPPSDLPPRISIFGLSALAPYYLNLFAGLARHLQINLFLLQPSQEYWGDITSPREGERIRRRHGVADAQAFQLHLHTGHRLLASLGYLGRDFLKLVLEAGDWVSDETFLEPGEHSLLQRLQSDILHLRDRGETPVEGEGRASAPAPVAPEDDSIQVHCCHSPLRELEVLQDRILDWLEHDPELTPRDIVVMTPDIESYAPLITAVFGAPESPERAIPFSVADRAGRRQSHLIDAYLRLLELPQSRLGAAGVLEILEVAVVRARFQMAEHDLALLRRWLEETGIRWGIDAAHRQELGLPALAGNTWREGLDRLLLGYGLAGGGTRLFQGILPHDELDSAQAAVLGRFLEFLDRIFETAESLRVPRPLDEWSQRLAQVLDDFFQPAESSAHEVQLLREALAEFERAHQAAGFQASVPLAVVLDRLRLALEDDIQQAGFLTGGVTFCGLKPMRSIPFKVVCLIGMNDGAFPRATDHLGFDLMAQSPRLGDRSTREDDRYLFLETLLSARQRLYLSYVGLSLRDNSVAPPSVLISEMLDVLQGSFQWPKPGGAAAHLVTRHRLQAFSEDYFQPGGRLFSYSQDNCRASGAVLQARTGPPEFCGQPLDTPGAPFREVTLERLSSFLASPARFFLNHRLGVYLPDEPEELEDREPFVLNALEEYLLKQELVEQQLRIGPRGDASWLPASGRLPLGTVGQTEQRRVTAGTEKFLARLQTHRPLTSPSRLDLDFVLGDFRVRGRVPELTEAGPLAYRCAKTKRKDILQAWVIHLATNCVQAGLKTTLIAEDGVRRYLPPEDPKRLLGDLLELYWLGLASPLKFFPRASFAYMEKLGSGTGGGAADPAALSEARHEWEGDGYRLKPESADAHFALCFRDTDPIDADFAILAERIVGPILQHEFEEEA
jgi:exodeoxyribonuclease V gamma subunit